MIAVALALSASAAWGISDFLGGVKAKSVPLAVVLVVSQTAGLIVIAFVLLGLGTPMPADWRLALGLIGGVAAVIDLGLIYLVLARGPVILIAPIAALGASIPVAAGVVGGDRMSGAIAAGLALALIGSLAASYEPPREDESGGLLAGLPLALGASAGIGVALILLDAASEVDPYWATGALRVGGFATALLLVGLLALRHRAPAFGALPLGLVPALALIGIFDVLADIGYSTASQEGDLSTISVLASMYPVVTVLLGYVILRERVLPTQLAGVALALAGVALLAGSA